MNYYQPSSINHQPPSGLCADYVPRSIFRMSPEQKADTVAWMTIKARQLLRIRDQDEAAPPRMMNTEETETYHNALMASIGYFVRRDRKHQIYSQYVASCREAREANMQRRAAQRRNARTDIVIHII